MVPRAPCVVLFVTTSLPRQSRARCSSAAVEALQDLHAAPARLPAANARRITAAPRPRLPPQPSTPAGATAFRTRRMLRPPSVGGAPLAGPPLDSGWPLPPPGLAAPIFPSAESISAGTGRNGAGMLPSTAVGAGERAGHRFRRRETEAGPNKREKERTGQRGDDSRKTPARVRRPWSNRRQQSPRRAEANHARPSSFRCPLAFLLPSRIFSRSLDCRLGLPASC